MGDRGNVKIKYGDDKSIYFYTHWTGSDLPKIVKEVLARKKRWDDSPYLARMIFCRMVEDSLREETGYGISPEICDNEHPIVEVDLCNSTVQFAEDDGTPVSMAWPFVNYIQLSDAELEGAFNEE